MKIQITEIGPQYWEQYKSLKTEALSREPLGFLDDFNETLDLHEEKWIHHLRHDHSKKNAIVLFALAEDRVVGIIAGFMDSHPSKEHIAYFASAYVKPEYRGQGIADMLIENLFTKIKKNASIVKIQLEVVASLEPATKFFNKHGFKQVGLLQKQHEIKGRYYDTVIMEKYL